MLNKKLGKTLDSGLILFLKCSQKTWEKLEQQTKDQIHSFDTNVANRNRPFLNWIYYLVNDNKIQREVNNAKELSL